MKMICFDLDGTIFTGESLPYIAQCNGLWEEYLHAATSKFEDDNIYSNSNEDKVSAEGSEEIWLEHNDDEETPLKSKDKVRDDDNKDKGQTNELTLRDFQRERGYKKNLLKRLSVFQGIPILKARGAIKTFPVNELIVDFIKRNHNRCAVVTSNLDCWVGEFLDSLGCEYHTSKATLRGGRIQSFDTILDKPSVLNHYMDKGFEVIYVGDGLNDVDAMKMADVSIAFLASEHSYKGLEELSDYCCYDQKDLIELLSALI